MSEQFSDSEVLEWIAGREYFRFSIQDGGCKVWADEEHVTGTDLQDAVFHLMSLMGEE